MAISTDPQDPSFGLETDKTNPNFGLPAQPSPTPQGQIERGNIDVSNRPIVRNSDGSVSTVKTIGVGTDKGEAVIPTVVNGKVVSNQEAIQHFKDTGEHLGVFDSPQNADAFATDLHNREAQRVQTESNQSREATRPTVSIPNLTASIFGESAGHVVQNAQDAGMDIVRGIPGMIESLPETAYQGLKFAAGGPQEKAQVLEQVAAEALPQGRQIAQDMQSPLGSRESFRGLASLGMLAIPSLTETIFGRATPEIPIETEKPPIQEPLAEIVPEPKRIVAAANRMSGGEVVAADSHPNAWVKAKEEGIPGNVEEAGFVTNTGEFLSRADAVDLARQSGQSLNPTVRGAPFLHSRDLVSSEGILGPTQAKALPDSKVLSGSEGRTASTNGGEVERVQTAPSSAAQDTGSKPAVPVSTEGEATVAQGNTKEVTPTAETPTTSGEVPPQGQAAPHSITSIKNEQVDAERETRGLPPVVEPARKAFGESWEQATKKIDDNPGYPDQLIDELKAKPRALNDVEDATLLHRQVDLQNQYQKSADLLIKARESGDEVGAMEHDARVNALSDQLLELYDVGKKSGTETGRGLAARKLLAAEDFSLANMVTQKRAANQGAALTPEQTADVNTASSKISAAKIAYDAYETSPKAEAYRNRLKTLTDQYEDRTAKGDFAPRQKTSIPLDKDGEQLKANLERAKKDWLTALQKDRAANRTPSQKFWDRFVGVERAMKLSSDVVLAKLTTAAAVREAGLTPLEEAAGAGIGKVLPGLAKRAPREGGFSPAAEIKAKAEMFTSGMKDAWRNLKMQQSDLDALYSSKKPPPPSEFYDYLGYLHGALKAPVKRAEFARSLTKRMEWAVRNGQDLNNVNTMRALSEQAYVDANRSIFMQDNVVASSFTNALRMAEKSKVAPNLGPAIARIGRFLVPIVKIPTNIVGEVATGVHGLATGGGRAAVAYLKGIDKLPTERADSIMRQLKKGAIGNSLILAGYYGANNIGGFYHDKDKRTATDVQPGRYRVGDVDLPASAGHSTGAMLLNIGATVKRVQDERIRKIETTTKGLGQGVLAAASGLAHEVPFVPAATGITDALGSQHGFEKYVNGMIQSTTVPALSSHIAKILDTPGSLPSNLLDEAVRRKPTNPLEAVKMGIPGLRQTVPERSDKSTKHKKEKIPTGEDTTPLN